MSDGLPRAATETDVTEWLKTLCRLPVSALSTLDLVDAIHLANRYQQAGKTLTEIRDLVRAEIPSIP